MSLWEATASLFGFADDFVLIATSKQCFHHALDRLSAGCDPAGMKISNTKQRYMPVQKPEPVVQKLQNIAASREVQEPWGGIHEWPMMEKGDWYRDSQSKRSSAWALSYGDKRGACIHRILLVFKSVFVPILTYGHEPLLMAQSIPFQAQATKIYSCELLTVHSRQSAQLRNS